VCNFLALIREGKEQKEQKAFSGAQAILQHPHPYARTARVLKSSLFTFNA
jgi:hypothetical protein